MAIIDTFLNLMMDQKADGLRIVPDDVPTLIKEDEVIRLSMPAVATDMIEKLVIEIVGAELTEPPSWGTAPVEGVYQAASGEVFAYRLQTRGTDVAIEMRCAATSPSTADTTATAHRPVHAEERHREDRVRAAVESTLSLQRANAARKPSIAPMGPASDETARLGEVPVPVLDILTEAVRTGASDLFLSSGAVPHVRLGGAISPVDADISTHTDIERLLPSKTLLTTLSSCGNVDFGAIFRLPIDGHASDTTFRFRINVFHHANGIGAAIRPVRPRIPTLAELNLPNDLYDLCEFRSGLVLVTGASGSGKTSTLAALIEHINQSKARHIITIEDPVEFAHRNAKSLIHQRELGTHVESFASGLRAALRENPDIIMLGEMRDLDTISAALTAAETGHLVFSTLHTGTAASAVTRIIDVFPGHQQPHVRLQLADSLRAVVAERLLPALRGKDRIPAIEKLIITHAVASQIREGRAHQIQSAIQTGGDEGMVTFERSLAGLVRRDAITRGTALAFCDDPHGLVKLIGS